MLLKQWQIVKTNMNSLFINTLISNLRQIANTPNILGVPFNANEAFRIRESVLTIAKDAEQNEPQISSQLIAAKDILFYSNQFGQAMINPYALGEAIFGLDYLSAKQQAKATDQKFEGEIWLYIHPLIQKSSKQLFEDGHYANAAEDAFIEINDRVKKIYKKLNPEAVKIPDGDTVMTTVFSPNNPMLKVCDISTDTGLNEQKGLMFMLQGAMAALRNPKAHKNIKITKDDAARRIMFASMLMYRIDDAVQFSEVKE